MSGVFEFAVLLFVIVMIVTQAWRQAAQTKALARGVLEMRQLREASYEQMDQHRATELWRWNNPP
jgi:hypothetical protein